MTIELRARFVAPAMQRRSQNTYVSLLSAPTSLLRVAAMFQVARVGLNRLNWDDRSKQALNQLRIKGRRSPPTANAWISGLPDWLQEMSAFGRLRRFDDRPRWAHIGQRHMWPMVWRMSYCTDWGGAGLHDMEYLGL